MHRRCPLIWRVRGKLFILTAIAAITSAQALSLADARSLEQNATTQVRDTIQLLYDRFDNSYLRGDFADIQALALPNARYLDERNEIDEPFVDRIEFWKSVRATGTSFTFRPASILAIQLDGKAAVVTVRREIQRFDSNSSQPSASVAFRRDDWSLTSSGWKLADYGVIGEFPSVVVSPASMSPWNSLKSGAENLDFSHGEAGEQPPGWDLGTNHTGLSSAWTETPGFCGSSERCAELSSQKAPPDQIAFLYQVIDVSRHRGSKFRLSARVRADVVGSGNVARLIARQHTDDGTTRFRDDLGNRPVVSSAWTLCELDGEIAPDARDLEFGLQLVGTGIANVRSISLQFY